LKFGDKIKTITKTFRNSVVVNVSQLSISALMTCSLPLKYLLLFCKWPLCKDIADKDKGYTCSSINADLLST
jgi:hypothetical protein